MDKDVLLFDKGHFHIDLGKFRLTVGAEIFITETAGDLVITVDPADHQKLFIDLWGLRECVKTSGVDAARNQIVARAFGSGFAEHRRFDV